ncbi:MAG TPA: TOPRIM nucleotidyl transferase/hydrolase domain-containing protein [Gaiellaceae bacterium]|nr:TOPRIM nucleotidyl transferase/hydrolase domain-containing protein [Gaiellaceae bacterium]
MERAVVLVEGTSDLVALETLALRRGRDLAAEGVVVDAIGGAQAVRRALARHDSARVIGLVDAGEADGFRRALDEVFVCDPDLEGELIRALGADEVLRVLDAHGDLGPFRTLQKQPSWRGRAVEEQLRRFLGSGGSRKIQYARRLVEALDLDRVPAPLDGVLAVV